jgi:hypothetical protein
LCTRAARRCLHEIQAVASLPTHPNVISQVCLLAATSDCSISTTQQLKPRAMHAPAERLSLRLLQYRAWQQRGHLFIQMDLAENGSLGALIREVCIC